MALVPWPVDAAARDRFVLERRPHRPPTDPSAPSSPLVEDERTADGTVARVATFFLTGKECPWRCVMCDLWQQTVPQRTPPGSIPTQIAALQKLLADAAPDIRQAKLYNAGSFFDPLAIPEADYDAVSQLVKGYGRVIVESHPALVGPRVDRLLEALHRQAIDAATPALEVAMGLETAHPTALSSLHKRMTLTDFESAARYLKSRGVALRVFLLISPPFIPTAEQDMWLLRSLDVALACEATAISMIPTRPGNGALEALAQEGLFSLPDVKDIERSAAAALAHVAGRARVFVNLWNLDQFAQCPGCRATRRQQLHAMNLDQQPRPAITCAACSGQTA